MNDTADRPLPCVSAVAVGAVSAFGFGEDAYRAAVSGEPARIAVGPDATLAAAGLLRPVAARAPAALPLRALDLASIKAVSITDAATLFDDRAAALLACAMDQLVTSLDDVRPGWRASRIAVALATSSGGMLSAERFFALRAAGTSPSDLAPVARPPTYCAPITDVLSAYGRAGAPRADRPLRRRPGPALPRPAVVRAP